MTNDEKGDRFVKHLRKAFAVAPPQAFVALIAMVAKLLNDDAPTEQAGALINLQALAIIYPEVSEFASHAMTLFAQERAVEMRQVVAGKKVPS